MRCARAHMQTLTHVCTHTHLLDTGSPLPCRANPTCLTPHPTLPWTAKALATQQWGLGTLVALSLPALWGVLYH